MMTENDGRESLLFFRRRLTEKIIVAMIGAAPNGEVRNYHTDPAATADDLANAICERLAARETGRPEGYA